MVQRLAEDLGRLGDGTGTGRNGCSWDGAGCYNNRSGFATSLWRGWQRAKSLESTSNGERAPGNKPTNPESNMPLVTVKVIENVFTPEQKKLIITKVTDALVSIEGESLRQVTWVVIEKDEGRQLGHRWPATPCPRCPPDAKVSHLRRYPVHRIQAGVARPRPFHFVATCVSETSGRRTSLPLRNLFRPHFSYRICSGFLHSKAWTHSRRFCMVSSAQRRRENRQTTSTQYYDAQIRDRTRNPRRFGKLRAGRTAAGNCSRNPVACS